MNRIQINMLEGECWYAMDVSSGLSMPIDRSMSGSIDLVNSNTKNQSAPFLVSNYGRYIWCEDGFKMHFRGGKITCKNDPSKHSIDLYEGFGTLKEAYLDAESRFFNFNGEYPDEMLFRAPQYCTYAVMGDEQTEKNILEYAESIIASGMRPGVITIDYGWQVAVGTWEFDLRKIPQPKLLINKLHDMGFKVRLWICPFVNTDADAYKYLKYGGMLVLDKTERVAKRYWWNGRDCILDMSNRDTVEWLESKCNALMDEYGVDGFKFEGGAQTFYRNSDITYNAVDANTQSMLWGKTASHYNLNEIRVCFKCSGLPLATRLYNKNYSFENGGLNEIVPDILMQGILGYPYGCPDMVGGSVVLPNTDKKDDGTNMELLIRYAEASALMPMMQYSLPIWKMDNKYVASLCKGAFDIHEKYSNYIMSLVKNASTTGEPIVRYLEYEFPHQGFHMVNDMFMLGSRYLVAPIIEPNKYKLTVRLPKGVWQYVDNELYEGEVTVDAPLEVLPIFEKIR